MPMLARTECEPPVDRHGHGERLEQPVGHLLRGRDVRVLEQHGELVAAQPGSGVTLPDRLADALGDALEQLVADGVAEAVVDVLEVVEVEEHHDERLGGTAAAAQRVRQPVGEELRFASPVSASWNAW